MYIRLSTVQVQSGKIDEAIRLYESLESERKDQRGFLTAWLGVNRDSGKAVSTTVWENLADIEATESSGWDEDVVSRFGPVVAGAPSRDTYEVVITVDNP